MPEESVRDTVVVAASAGGVEVLRELFQRLPADLPAAVLAVLHVPAAGGRLLPRILGRASHLPVAAATDGQALTCGQVYVAPPDRHLLVADGHIRLSDGPRHNGVRPAADPLFVSAALSAAQRVIGVVLSGTLDDGAAGCAAVERRGGLVLVQDPDESAYDGMPRAAIAATERPLILPVAQIATVIGREAGRPQPGTPAPPDPALARQLDLLLNPALGLAGPPGLGGGVTCPECGGLLRQVDDSTPVRFGCAAGHVWSPESLVTAQAAGIERALWAAALRLEERARLNDMLAEVADSRGHARAAGRFRTTALTSHSAAGHIRRLLESAGVAEPAELDPSAGFWY